MKSLFSIFEEGSGMLRTWVEFWISLLICLASATELACGSVSETTRVPTAEPQPTRSTSLVDIRKVSKLPTDGAYCPDGFQFVDRSNGWTFCNGKLFRTRNGGETWQMVYATTPDEHEFVTFSFVDSRVGCSYTSRWIKRTDDGGSSWEAISNPVRYPHGIIESVRFLRDGKHGWLAASVFHKIPPELRGYGFKPAYSNGSEALKGTLFQTSDNGKTWREVKIPVSIGTSVNHLYLSDSDELWALGDQCLMRLEDGGWSRVDFKKSECDNSKLLATVGLSEPHSDTFDLVEISFADQGHGWISFSNGFLARTTDAGHSWCDLLYPNQIQAEPNENSTFARLSFTDPNNGWGLTRGGKLYRTIDGGSNWERADTNLKFSDMLLLDAQQALLISKDSLYRFAP
jgi:photosystem II stability/assembly factor-like uncharacterized protein